MFEDNRTRYTRKVIQDAFFELLNERPINKITVKSICDLAQINRSTFYRYYMDVYDLLDKIQKKYISDFREYAGKITSLEEGVTLTLQEVQSNSEIYKMFTTIQLNSNSFIDEISEISYDTFHDAIAELLPDKSDAEIRWTFYFLIHGFMAIVLDWIKTGMVEPASMVSEHVTELFKEVL